MIICHGNRHIHFVLCFCPPHHQIDDFLNGKFPLSVAIRVGESVVVVNLHRAKVEEIEMEPPPQKRRCVRTRHPNRDEMDFLDPISSALYSTKRHHHHHHSSSASTSASTRDSFRCLNTNHSGPEPHPTASAMSTSDYHHHHHHHRRTNTCPHPLDAASSKSHRSLGKSRDSSGSRRHHHHRMSSRTLPPSPPSSLPQAPDRTMLTCTHDLSGVPMETSVAIAATPSIDSACRPPTPCATPIIGKDAPVMATTTPQSSHRVLAQVIKDARRGSVTDSIRLPTMYDEKDVEHSTMTMKTDAPIIESLSSDHNPDSVSVATPMDCSNQAFSSSPTSAALPSSAVESTTSKSDSHSVSSGVQCVSSKSASHSSGVGSSVSGAAPPRPSCSSCSGVKMASHSVQTDRDPNGKDNIRKKHDPRIDMQSSKDRKSTSSSRREVKLPENGISMKRKAVMEAISEILKKMYANAEKGRLPGSFKGRFSSEFTCDGDMREILHSKTTMTSYGSEGDELDSSGSCNPDHGGRSLANGRSNLSKAKLEENQSLKDKVANLKWKLQHKRAMKIARRNGEKSPCGWMDTVSCEVPDSPPEAIERASYCGMKRGFLLDPYC